MKTEKNEIEMENIQTTDFRPEIWNDLRKHYGLDKDSIEIEDMTLIVTYTDEARAERDMELAKEKALLSRLVPASRKNKKTLGIPERDAQRVERKE